MTRVQKFTIDQQARYLLAYLGLKETEILQKAQLPLKLFEQKSILLTADEYCRLWEAIATEDNDERPLPLRLIELPLFTSISPPVMAALCAPDFITCAERLKEYKPLIGPLRLTLTESEDQYSVEISPVDESVYMHANIAAMELLFFVALIRHATGERIRPLKVESVVEIEHPAYLDYFGVEIVATGRNRLTFARADALKPFKLRNDAAWAFFEPEMRQRLDELEVDDSFSASVRSVLMELLPLGESSVEAVAGKLFVSPRTLQRKLKAENTSFQAQLNHSRELLARHYLSNSEMSITEIAFLVGYQETSSFSRAFAHWTGQPPEQFRQAANS